MKATKLDVRPVSRLFRALGDETRLRIIGVLSHGELCVCHIQDALELPQPTISRQLAVLRAAEVVEDRREGSWVYYRLRPQPDPECDAQLGALIKSFSVKGARQADVFKLRKSSRSRKCK